MNAKCLSFDVDSKWLGIEHDARVLANSNINQLFKNSSLPRCPKVIVEGEDFILVGFIEDPTNPLSPYLMKDFAKGGKQFLFVFSPFRHASRPP